MYIPDRRHTDGNLSDENDLETQMDPPASATYNIHARSASFNPYDPGASQLINARTSLEPLPEARELTEPEKDAKFGNLVQISVEMVHDPRIEVTPQIAKGVERFGRAVIAGIRAVSSCHHGF